MKPEKCFKSATGDVKMNTSLREVAPFERFLTWIY